MNKAIHRERKKEDTIKTIRRELEKLGIVESVVDAATVDGAPAAVLLRWNGAEEYVTATHFALGTEDVRDELDEIYITWLQQNFK